jgi:hypothetical protein
MFDASQPIQVKVRTADGIKAIRVRFPTDEEWIERQRRRKVLIKHLGRGVTETAVSGGEEADAELLAKIRDGDGPEVDPYEASRIIEQLAQADVDEVVREGDAFRVILRVPGGTVAHLLRMPSAKDVIEYRRRFARVLDLPYGKQELRVNLEAAGELHQKLLISADGYAAQIPIVHQAVAVKTAIDELDTLLTGDGDPN